MTRDPRHPPGYAAIPLREPPPWWRRLFSPPRRSCIHASTIDLDPDRVPLRNRTRATVREPPRPPVELCPDCTLALLEKDWKSSSGRVIAFEPAAEGLTRYLFVEQEQIGDVGLGAEDLIHCQSLLAEPLGGCQKCGQPALVLLVKRGSTTEPGSFVTFRGGKEYYCQAHGSERLLGLLRERLPRKSPVTFFNFPYGERGVYLPTD